MLKEKKQKTNPKSIFLSYQLIAITLLILFCFSSYTVSCSLASSLPYNFVQQSITQKISTTSLEYNNPIYGITIQYPSNWQKIEYSKTALTVGGSNLIVNFLAPLIDNSDHWREHFMIQVLKQGQAKKLVPQSQITIGDQKGFESLSDSTMQIFNIDKNTESTLNIKKMDVWITSSDGNTYLLTYKALASRYQDYMPTVQRMIDSFKIENSTVVKA